MKLKNLLEDMRSFFLEKKISELQLSDSRILHFIFASEQLITLLSERPCVSQCFTFWSRFAAASRHLEWHSFIPEVRSSSYIQHRSPFDICDFLSRREIECFLAVNKNSSQQFICN